MDLDGNSLPGPGDIDQNLLLQFSSMNTTDRDELISQMQILLAPTMNYNTASFFLDMSNWNLQAAIGCYLDYTLPSRLPSMSIKTASGQQGTVTPGSSFEPTWSIANTGTDQWPGSCRLVQAGGHLFGAEPFYVPPLFPGHSTTVTLKLVAPTEPGDYKGFFHLLTDKGDILGDTLWVEVKVESEMAMALADQLAALPIPSSRQSSSQMSIQEDHNMS